MIFKIISRAKGGGARFFLTITGIAIGVFSVVLISSISSSGIFEISKTLDRMGINSVLVQSPRYAYTPFVDEDIAVIKRLDAIDPSASGIIKNATPLMAETAEASLLGKKIDCFAWGINEDARDIISLEAKHGRLINRGDNAVTAMVCVIDEDIALTAYERGNIVGKSIKLLIGGAYYDFEIIGIAKSGISPLQSSFSGFFPKFVYLPITTTQVLTGRRGYDKIAVLINENSENLGFSDYPIAEKIEKKMALIKGEGKVTASSLLGQKNQLENIITVITVVLTIIAGISLLVSGLSVMTVMITSVNERKREIGIKKAIGAKSIDICFEFLSEAMLLSFTGGIIGAAASLLVVFIGCQLVGITFILNLPAVFWALCVSLFFGAVFGVYPAGKAAGMKPVEALRET
ncbi:MAG: ABC transporter permease [Eubacterium sp.]|nr:ABC transporter permease [Eubacterium sp.]